MTQLGTHLRPSKVFPDRSMIALQMWFNHTKKGFQHGLPLKLGDVCVTATHRLRQLTVFIRFMQSPIYQKEKGFTHDVLSDFSSKISTKKILSSGTSFLHAV